jgi:hypothetical protein
LTGATDIGAAIVDADLLLVDDGAGGTLRKTAASRLKTYVGAAILSGSTNNTVATVTGANALVGEATLTYDATTLAIIPTGTQSNIRLQNSTSGSGSTDGFLIQETGNDTYLVNYENAGMYFRTNNTDHLNIQGSGTINTGGETAGDVGAGGICIDQNALDTFAMTLKSSDVAHGITDNAETDTFATFGKQDADNGGVFIQGITENDSPIVMRGFYVTDNTYKTAQGNGAIRVEVGKKNGTALAVAGADANIFSVRKSIGGNNTVFIVDEDGDIYYDGSAASYDTYDDALLVRAYDNYAAPDAVIQSKFDKFIKYNRQSLIDAKLIGDCPIEDELAGTNKPLVSLTGMSRLHNGAIWQQYEKHNQLLEAVYELAKESIGEKKAKAILKKHEVKRLN